MPDILRFAPSPTGALHVGGVRTALLNWLHARHYGGKYFLRIEDTDQERSDLKSVKMIQDGFYWLGIEFDGEPTFQSLNADRHRAAVQQLLASGHAYRCYCSAEKLEEKRQRAMSEKRQFKYDRFCLALTPDQKADLDARQAPYVVRLQVPEGETVWQDPMRGECRWSNEVIEDLILMRSNGWPTYNLAVVVDDQDMGITLVMRGPEHISNTPKQVLIARALGFDPPRFSHLCLILGPDKKKLSKRHGATSIMEYKERGYLPSSVLNFLALLGWSPGDGREKMPLQEMIDAYSVEGLSAKDAVFDEQKLEWLNSQHLNDLSPDQLLDAVCPFWVAAGLVSKTDPQSDRSHLRKIVILLRERCKLLTDFVEKGRFFFQEPESFDESARRKHWSDPEVIDRLSALADRFEVTDPFHAISGEGALRALSESMDLPAAKLIHATRLAVSGVSGGPGLFEILETLGRETVVRRMRRAAELVRKELQTA